MALGMDGEGVMGGLNDGQEGENQTVLDMMALFA